MTRLARAKTRDYGTMFGLVEDDMFVPLPQHEFGGEIGDTGVPIPLSHVQVLSPSSPRNILLMWRAFYKEGDKRRVDHPPYLAVKASGTLPGGHGSDVVIPELVGGPLAAEAELAVVIGAPAKNVGPEDAANYIAGFTVMNDITSPALIHATGQWPSELPRLVSGTVLAKCFDTFSPFGPWIETSLTTDEVRSGLAISTLVNGEEKMRGTTSDFKFAVEEVISHASRVMTLQPGDVITLGTPGIVLVDEGDVVECQVEGVGSLRNTIVAAPLT